MAEAAIALLTAAVGGWRRLARSSPARKLVAELASSGGLNPVDVGPLKRARELEAFQLLHMRLQQPRSLGWMSGIKILAA